MFSFLSNSHLWSFHSLAFLPLFLCFSALPFPTACSASPALLLSSPPISFCKLLGPSSSPSQPAWQQAVPKAPLLSSDFSSAGDGSSKPQILIAFSLPVHHQKQEVATRKGRRVS